METITFKKSGGPIKFRLIVKTGVLGVNYSFELCKRNCSKPLIIYEGNNYHKKEHFHYLPSPINNNHNRVLKLKAEYLSHKTDVTQNYILSFEVFQKNHLLKSIEKADHFSCVEQQIELNFLLKMAE